VTLLYFAWVRQKLGRSEEKIELPAGVSTVAELTEHLRQRGDGFAEVFSDLRRLRAAVNQEHGGWNTGLHEGDEVAFFPPVTGG
jgi:molybdopterin synthase sulfur carrier subunit